MMCYRRSPYAEGYFCQLDKGHEGVCMDDDDQPFIEEGIWLAEV